MGARRGDRDCPSAIANRGSRGASVAWPKALFSKNLALSDRLVEPLPDGRGVDRVGRQRGRGKRTEFDVTGFEPVPSREVVGRHPHVVGRAPRVSERVGPVTFVAKGKQGDRDQRDREHRPGAAVVGE